MEFHFRSLERDMIKTKEQCMILPMMALTLILSLKIHESKIALLISWAGFSSTVFTKP